MLGESPVLMIDAAALAANWRALAALAPAQGRAGAVVKANAYGLGAEAAGQVLWVAGCRDFFVVQAGEGAALRAVLPEADIHVLNGPMPDSVAALRTDRLIPTLSTPAQIALWAEAAPGAPCSLQIETGMHRLGLTADQLAALVGDPALTARLAPVLIISHLACADDPAHPLNAGQLAAFAAAAAPLSEAFPAARLSLANSFGSFLGPGWRQQVMRPGIALYGGNPTPGRANPMRPVVRLTAPILQINLVPPGAAIGYGATWRADGPRRIATAAIGYADGVRRSLSNRWQGVIADHRVPMVGRVSMDLVTFDVSDLPEARLAGAGHVTLLDADRDIEAMAAAAGTISYEILTGIGPRVDRHWVHPTDSG